MLVYAEGIDFSDDRVVSRHGELKLLPGVYANDNIFQLFWGLDGFNCQLGRCPAHSRVFLSLFPPETHLK